MARLCAPAPREAFVTGNSSKCTANRQQREAFKYLKGPLQRERRRLGGKAADDVQPNKQGP